MIPTSALLLMLLDGEPARLVGVALARVWMGYLCLAD